MLKECQMFEVTALLLCRNTFPKFLNTITLFYGSPLKVVAARTLFAVLGKKHKNLQLLLHINKSFVEKKQFVER